MTDKTLPFSLPVEIEKFETFLANRLEEPLPHCVYLILFLPIRFLLYWMLIYFLFTNATCSVFGFGKQVTYEINMPLEMIYIITLVLTSIVIVIKVRRRKNERKDILQRNLLIKKDLENKSYLLLTDSIKRACEQVEYTEDGDYTSYYYTTVCESIDTIRDNRLIEPYLDENNERIKVFRQMREFCTTKEHFKTLKEGAISYYLVGMSSGCCSHAIK